MPAGVTWGRYMRFFIAAMLSMFAGAQVVHTFYKPLDDMAEWVEREKSRQASESAKAARGKES